MAKAKSKILGRPRVYGDRVVRSVYLTEEELALFQQTATDLGISFNQFVVQAMSLQAKNPDSRKLLKASVSNELTALEELVAKEIEQIKAKLN